MSGPAIQTAIQAEIQVFAGLPVRDFQAAVEWYAGFFGRSADEVVGDEAMWQANAGTWLFVLPDSARAGGAVLTLGVASLAPYLARWRAVGIGHEPEETYGNGVQHVTVVDPDGNSVSLAAAPAGEDDSPDGAPAAD